MLKILNILLTGEALIKKGKLIDENDCEKIDAAGVKSVQVYSVIHVLQKGVCQLVMVEIYQEEN